MNSDRFLQHSLLNQSYREAAIDLFSLHNMSADVLEEGQVPAGTGHKSSYVSVLGVCGEGVALSSMLTIDRELLIGIHPLNTAGSSQQDLGDWCRELNNQLVGRVKNKLLRFGIAVSLGVPALLTGSDVTAITPPGFTLNEHFLRIGDGWVKLSLATLVGEGVEFLEQESAPLSDGAMLEGAVALF